jgi:REP element-mobilizing transposase RayT
LTITGIIESLPICEPSKVQKDEETNDEYTRKFKAYSYVGRRKNFTGQKFWARGYVSTVGRDEETVINYIKDQEEEDKRIDQLD